MATTKVWTEADIPNQVGRVAVVTGANSGIGWNTALELARKGGEVILAARTEAKGTDAVDRIRRIVPGATVRYEGLDLASLRSVRAFAERVGSGRVDLLVNNARVMNVPTREMTEDGFERQFGTNFLGPFALTLLLVPALKRSRAPRVTTVSSGAAQMGLKRIRFEDLQWDKGYGPWKAYCQTKLADLLLMMELGRKATAAGWSVVSNGAHPGYARTNLQTAGAGKEMNAIQKMITPFISHDAAAGARPTLRAATEAGAGTGSYFAPERLFHLVGNAVPVKLPKEAQDVEAARKLWGVAEELTGVRWTDLDVCG